MGFYLNSLLPGTSAHHDKEGPVAKVVHPVVLEHVVQFPTSWRTKSKKSLAGSRSQHHFQGPCSHLFLLNRSVFKVPHPSPKASSEAWEGVSEVSILRGWEDVSEVTLFRGPESGSKHTHCTAHNCLYIQVQDIPCSLLASEGNNVNVHI